MRMSTKLMLATFGLLLIPLLSLSWNSYQNSAAIVSKNQHDLMYSVLESNERTLTTFQNQVNTLLLSAAADERLWTQPEDKVEGILSTYARYNPNISNLYIVRPDRRPVGVPRWLVRSLGRQATTTLQKFITQPVDGVFWTEPYHSPLSNWTVTAGVRATLASGESPGYVMVDLPLVALRQVLPNSRFEDATALVLSRSQTPIIADYAAPFLHYTLRSNKINVPADVRTQLERAKPGSILTVTLDKQRFLVLAGAANRFGWRTMILLSNHVLEQATGQVQQSSVNALILLSLICLGLAWFAARYFGMPLEQLAREMERVRLGQLEGVRHSQRTDEIGQLAQAFNGMMARLHDLIEDLRRTEQRKKEAEIQLLQSQIRPHFLYNTLNAMGHAAAMGRTEDVYRMIQSLTFLLSFTFDKVQDKVALAKELEFTDHYLRLQRIRYGNQFQVVYDVAPDIGQCAVLKLTLQPIVENAIFHGLSQQPIDPLLHISARRENNQLILQVRDNGPGMSKDALELLESDSTPGRNGHVGMRNVRERLQLHYGPSASLAISTAHHGTTGTTVTITIPVEQTAPVAVRYKPIGAVGALA